MSTRLSLEERIQAVRLYAKSESIVEVQRKWKNYFSTEPPSRPTIKVLVDKFRETGSIHDRKRSGRHRSVVTEDAIENVTEALIKSSNLSIRQGTQAMDMSKTQFKLNGTINRHNCCYWAFSNPQERISVSNSKEGLMVWCGISSKGLIGPYFFEGSVTGKSYLEMLKDYLWPQVKQRGLYFQQDGSPVHFALEVRRWLDEKFPDRWIGRGGPIKWPPRSPDLTPPDFFLWGYLKNIVYRDKPLTLDELRDRIERACEELSKEMCERACKSVVGRFKECLETNGGQISN